MPLGNALISSRGYASLEVASMLRPRPRAVRAHRRRRARCLPVLYGAVGQPVRARAPRAGADGRARAAPARRAPRPGVLIVAERAVGWPLVCMGRFDEARAHLDRDPAACTTPAHRPLRFRVRAGPGASAGLATGAWALWGCGESASGRASGPSRRSPCARETDHPLSVTYALCHRGAAGRPSWATRATARERALAALALAGALPLAAVARRGACTRSAGPSSQDGDPERAARDGARRPRGGARVRRRAVRAVRADGAGRGRGSHRARAMRRCAASRRRGRRATPQRRAASGSRTRAAPASTGHLQD